MKVGNSTVCDGCDEVVEGIVGTAMIRKSRYLTIEGTMSMAYWDKYKTIHWCYGNEAPGPKAKTYHFCNGFCLDDYMGQQLIMKARYHEQNGLPLIDTTKI